MSNPIVEALKAARQSIRIHRRTLASKDWGVSMPLDDAEASLRTVAAGVESLVAENARLRAALEKHEGPAVTDTCSVCGEAVERLRTSPPDYWWRHVAPEHRFLHDVVRAPSRETTE